MSDIESEALNAALIKTSRETIMRKMRLVCYWPKRPKGKQIDIYILSFFYVLAKCQNLKVGMIIDI